jgi:hypothetical protein
MASHNDITGDALVSRVLSKKGEEAFEQIFGKKKTNGGWKPPLSPLKTNADWDESRIDTIGQNGNDGEHYEETK